MADKPIPNLMEMSDEEISNMRMPVSLFLRRAVAVQDIMPPDAAQLLALQMIT